MRLEIPMRTPSLNAWQRMHWAERRRRGAEWARAVWAANGNRGWSHANGRVAVTVERGYQPPRQRPLDRDNLYGGAKPLVDALTRNRLIVDDRDEWLDLTIRNAPGVDGTIITLVHEPAQNLSATDKTP